MQTDTDAPGTDVLQAWEKFDAAQLQLVDMTRNPDKSTSRDRMLKTMEVAQLGSIFQDLYLASEGARQK